MILDREVIDFCYQSCAYQIYIRMKLNWLNFLTCRACRFLSRIKEVCIFQLSTLPYAIISTQIQQISVLSLS